MALGSTLRWPRRQAYQISISEQTQSVEVNVIVGEDRTVTL
jgi:hypothetical protein